MGMFSKLKQFKDLRSQAKELQSKLAEETETGTGAKGAVKITLDGNQKVQKVEIDPEKLSADNKELLEKGVQDAFDDAVKKIQKIMAKKMKDMGGMDNFPGM